MAGIRTTTVTNCFIRLAAREPFHSQLAPQGRHSSWLYALFSSASCSSSFYFVFFFQHAAEYNVTRSWDEWMNGDAHRGRAMLFWNRTDQRRPTSDLRGEFIYVLSRVVERLTRSLLFLYRRSLFLWSLLNYVHRKKFFSVCLVQIAWTCFFLRNC